MSPKPVILPRALYPAAIKPHARRIRGVCLFGCIDPSGATPLRAEHEAHVHVDRSARVAFEGWICIRTARALGFRELLLHEVAHLLTRRGHDERWRRKVREIGGKLGPVWGLHVLDYRKGAKRPRGL